MTDLMQASMAVILEKLLEQFRALRVPFPENLHRLNWVHFGKSGTRKIEKTFWNARNSHRAPYDDGNLVTCFFPNSSQRAWAAICSDCGTPALTMSLHEDTSAAKSPKTFDVQPVGIEPKLRIRKLKMLENRDTSSDDFR